MGVSLDDLDAVVEVVDALCDVLSNDLYIHAELRFKIENIAARARYIRKNFLTRGTNGDTAEAVSALKNWDGLVGE